MQVQKVLTFEEYAAKCKGEDKLYVRKVFLKSTRFENAFQFVLKKSADSFIQSGHWQVVQIPTAVPESVKEIISEPKKK